MKTIRKLTPALLKRIIAEEKEKIEKESLLENKKKIIRKKLNISKEQLIELVLIHKRQKEAAAKFKRLHERKERIKKLIKKKG
jgi:hypothetical protein